MKICEFVIFGLTIKICAFRIWRLAHLRICGFAIAELLICNSWVIESFVWISETIGVVLFSVRFPPFNAFLFSNCCFYGDIYR